VGGIQTHPPAPATIVSPPVNPATQVAPPVSQRAPETQIYPAASSSTQPQYAMPTTPQDERRQASPQTPPVYAPPQYQPPGVDPADTGAGLQKNIAGLLCYLVIPAIIFLVLEPYNKSRFIRFHAFQALMLAAASIVTQIALTFLIILMPGFIDWIFSLASTLASLGFFVLWIFMMVKAYGNEMYKLPVIGDLADQQAGR
jgi:uncharacterized membrane protein